jgi:hypothetical protein
MDDMDVVDDAQSGRGQDAPEPDRAAAAGQGQDAATPSGQPRPDRKRSARARRAAARRLGISPWLLSAYNVAVAHREQVERTTRMAASMALPSLLRAVPDIQPLVKPSLLLPTGPVYRAWNSPALDLLRGMTWPVDNGITLLTDRFRALWTPIHDAVAWQLDLWSRTQDLAGRVLLAEARLVREHLLTGELSPVEL